MIEISLLSDQEQAEFEGLQQQAAPAAAPAEEAVRREQARPQAIRAQKLQEIQKPEREQPSDLPGRSDDADAGISSAPRVSNLEEADGLTSQPVTSDIQSPAAFQSTAPSAERAREAATERYCDESQTADPNSWLECILELERQGLHEAARLERDLLAEAFPPPELVR